MSWTNPTIMSPTMHLRFIERKHYEGDVAAPIVRRVLQQCWTGISHAKDEAEQIVEWRDVPLATEGQREGSGQP